VLKTYPRSYERTSKSLTGRSTWVLCRYPARRALHGFFNQSKLWRSTYYRCMARNARTRCLLLRKIGGRPVIPVSVMKQSLRRRSEVGQGGQYPARVTTCFPRKNITSALMITVAAPLLKLNPDLVAYDCLTGGGRMDSCLNRMRKLKLRARQRLSLVQFHDRTVSERPT
jgi:hypothetical protein